MEENTHTSQQPIQEIPVTAKHVHIPRVLLVLFVALISAGVFGTIGYLLGIGHQATTSSNLSPNPARTNIVTKPTTIPTNDVSPTTTIDNGSMTNWKTYTSTVEKASFKYPTNWTEAKPSIQSNIPNADVFAIQSPSGLVKLTWVSALDGFGGGCNDKASLGEDGACPQIYVIDKTAIKGATGLFVVTGTITRDNKTFQPWMAVQDSTGLVTTQRGMGYDLFTGHNNGTSISALNGHNTTALFSTSTAYAGGPSMSQADANTYFHKPEVKQAQQILLSLTY